MRHTSYAHKNYPEVLKAHPALADILLLTLFVKVNVTRRDTFVRTVTNFVTWWLIGVNIVFLHVANIKIYIAAATRNSNVTFIDRNIKVEDIQCLTSMFRR